MGLVPEYGTGACSIPAHIEMYGTAPLLSCSAPGLSCPAPGLTDSPAVCCFEGFVVASGLGCPACSTPGPPWVWHGYGTGMVRSCKISPQIFLIRATPGTWSVPYLWNGPLYHTWAWVWNGPCSIPMERTLFHTMVRKDPRGLHHTFNKNSLPYGFQDFEKGFS